MCVATTVGKPLTLFARASMRSSTDAVLMLEHENYPVCACAQDQQDPSIPTNSVDAPSCLMAWSSISAKVSIHVRPSCLPRGNLSGNFVLRDAPRLQKLPRGVPSLAVACHYLPRLLASREMCLDWRVVGPKFARILPIHSNKSTGTGALGGHRSLDFLVRPPQQKRGTTTVGAGTCGN